MFVNRFQQHHGCLYSASRINKDHRDMQFIYYFERKQNCFHINMNFDFLLDAARIE